MARSTGCETYEGVIKRHMASTRDFRIEEKNCATCLWWIDERDIDLYANRPY
jgi:hypothetical protein